MGLDYTVDHVDLSHDPTTYQTTQTTPGELVVGDVNSDQYSVATADGSPRVTASASIVTGVGGALTASILTYDFEIVPDLGQGELSPVTVELNAIGSISGSATSPPSSYALLNGANVTADFQIAYTYNAIAQAYFSYYCILSDNDCSQSGNSSTSNVSVDLGPTSTYSGGFDLAGANLNLITDHPYQVTLTAELELGSYPGTATASVDPEIIVPAGYTLVLSPGISGAVPEPATWAMMLLGFGSLGALMRRRRVLSTGSSDAGKPLTRGLRPS